MGNVMRLDKLLSEMGAGSRNEIREMARKGRIQVNGVTEKKADRKVDPQKDTVALDSIPISYAKWEYYMLNKPQGVVSATEDNVHQTVIDLLKKQPGGPKRKDLFPVGRLDIDTEGLLLITNDGELAHNLLSPRHHVDKRYYARVAGELPEDAGLQFEQGITLSDGTPTLPAKLEVLEKSKSAQNNLDTIGQPKNDIRKIMDGTAKAADSAEATPHGAGDDCGFREVILTIQEGKFHQVKRMFEALGCQVIFLKRLSMGSLVLDENLKAGEYRALSSEEVESLRSWGQPVSRQGNPEGR